MLDALLTVILPVVLVASVGALLGHRFTLDNDTVGKVSLYGLTPALAFSSLLTTSVSAGQGLLLGAGYLLSTAVAGGLGAVLADRGARRTVIACTVIGNNGNFGLPIALLALGRAGLDQAVVIFLLSLVVMFTAGPALLGRSSGLTGAVRSVARLPVTWAMLAALAVRSAGWTPPLALTRAVDLLAAAAVPMVLLSLGMQLVTSRRLRITRVVVLATVLRVAVLPAAAFGTGLLLGLDETARNSLLLAQTMPTAVNTFMLAREYGTDTDQVATIVALTTLLSVPILTVVVSTFSSSL